MLMFYTFKDLLKPKYYAIVEKLYLMWDIGGFLKDTRRGLLKNESFGGWWSLKIAFLFNYSLFSTRGRTEHRFPLLYQNSLFPGGWKTKVSRFHLPIFLLQKVWSNCVPSQRLFSPKGTQDTDGKWNSSEKRGAGQLLFSGRLCLRSQGFIEEGGGRGNGGGRGAGRVRPLGCSLDFPKGQSLGQKWGMQGEGASVKWVRSLHFSRTVCPLECFTKAYYVRMLSELRSLGDLVVLELASNCLWKNLDWTLKCHWGLLF